MGNVESTQFVDVPVASWSSLLQKESLQVASWSSLLQKEVPASKGYDLSFRMGNTELCMASLRKIDRIIQFFMRFYRIQRYKTSPHTPLNSLLNECKVALITTAGFYLPEQPPFDSNDCSYREIPNSIQTEVLSAGHKSEAYDKRGIEIDVNLAFPLDRFKELESEGKIGSLNYRHFSFMGSITKPKSLITQTAPEVAQMLKDDGVNVAFLTPI